MDFFSWYGTGKQEILLCLLCSWRRFSCSYFRQHFSALQFRRLQVFPSVVILTSSTANAKLRCIPTGSTPDLGLVLKSYYSLQVCITSSTFSFSGKPWQTRKSSFILRKIKLLFFLLNRCSRHPEIHNTAEPGNSLKLPNLRMVKLQEKLLRHKGTMTPVCLSWPQNKRCCHSVFNLWGNNDCLWFWSCRS